MTAPLVVLAKAKGGTGATTLAVALAAAWRDAGHAVALVDADPQAGATRALGVTPAEHAAPATAAHGVTLWPSGRDLAHAPAAAWRARLAAATEGGAGLVLVDMAPAVTDAAHAVALPAAALALIVARCDAAGLAHVVEAVQLADAAGAGVVRVVPTFARGTTLAREALAWLRGRFGDRVTATTIPADVKAEEAPGHGAPVTDTAPRSRVAKAVHALAAELAPLVASATPATAGATA